MEQNQGTKGDPSNEPNNEATKKRTLRSILRSTDDHLNQSLANRWRGIAGLSFILVATGYLLGYKLLWFGFVGVCLLLYEAIEAAFSNRLWRKRFGIHLLAYVTIFVFCYLAITHEAAKELSGQIAEQKFKAGVISEFKQVHSQIDPRQLDDNQIQSILNTMSAFKGQKATISCLKNDSDGLAYGQWFREALTKAGWDFNNLPIEETDFAVTFRNVTVAYNPNAADETTRNAASALASELVQIGVVDKETRELVSPSVGRNEVAIWIGQHRLKGISPSTRMVP